MASPHSGVSADRSSAVTSDEEETRTWSSWARICTSGATRWWPSTILSPGRRRRGEAASEAAAADAFTRKVIAAVEADGTCWLGGTTWHGMAAMRISVSNWSTTEPDADLSVEAILPCAKAAAASLAPVS